MARTSVPSADIRGRATTTSRTPSADAPAHVAAWSWKRCAHERAFSEIWSISPSSPPASSTKWYVSSPSIPDTRQDSQPSIPSLKWCRGGLPPTAGQRPLPVCAVRHCSTTTYGMNTAIWRCAGTKNPVHTTSLRDAPTPDSVSFPKWSATVSRANTTASCLTTYSKASFPTAVRKRS